MEAFFESFVSLLEARYPRAAGELDMRTRLSPLLLCPHTVPLAKSLREQATRIVQSFFALRNDPSWQARLSASTSESHFSDPGNFSALMSYDFHIDDSGQLRLIEINTNASMALMTDLLYELKGVPNGFTDDFKATIIETFRREFAAAFPRGRKLERAAIIDENPSSQRLYAEFLLYRELFEKNGIATKLADPADLQFQDGELRLDHERIDLVYNRDTDFYFDRPAAFAIKNAIREQAVCVSPHPHEYRLLADKQRLLDLSRPGVLEACSIADELKDIIHATLIRTMDVQEFTDHDALWSERKKWFFKTKQSFGGKAAYRGSSIGRPVFAQILSGSYLAQEYVPPSTVTVTVPVLPSASETKDEFKMDLRFFAYRDEVQLACARLYKGQMTNSQTLGGGVAAIEWV